MSDSLYQAFLQNLREIERFRATHLELYKDTPLEIDDPNVKRMIEALAFYGAQSRLQAVDKMTQMHQCLFRQYFPFLLNPLPSVSMLQVAHSLKNPEIIDLPAGTEFYLCTDNNPKATFQTLEPLSLLPMSIAQSEFEKQQDHTYLFSMTYRLSEKTNKRISEIPFYINHLSSFFSSLRIFFALQRSMESITITYDCEEPQTTKATFGYRGHRKILTHPVEQVRTFFHFPQQELYMTLDLPEIEKGWKEITITIRLSSSWPSSIKLTDETFVPFAVPIINLKTEYSDPVICDGTKEGYPLLHPEPSLKYQLHTVLHVAKILPTGTKTLKPGILGRKEETYEIDYHSKHLLLNMPKAFTKPETLTVKALWTQPWFADTVNEEQTIQASISQLTNKKTRLLSKIYPYENTQQDDPNYLLRIFSLKNQNTFTLNELLFILNAAKNLDNSLFDIIPDLIVKMQTNQKIKDNNTGSLMEYEFFLKNWGGQKWELVVLFFVYLHKFLHAWLSYFEIEVKVHIPGAKRPLIIKGGKQNELTILAKNFFLS
ncbi:MAG: type VI secretion system baseplate subunit TssF/IglH [Candidatus Algichlamydia australiensis]|nr:type VI secretion system baseplate subunit TssF/IglH [Chlamydiales bacterium]